MNQKKIFSNSNGCPTVSDDYSKQAFDNGSVLIEDYQLIEKLAHFDRERIPERVVHAVGSGAYGYFIATNKEMSKYTTAKVFTELDQKTEVFVRFSTVAGSKGASDEVRDPRGFAVRFYTTQGNLDIVGNNTPVFFIRDAKKFPDFIHTQKPAPHNNLSNPDAQWDFWSKTPESIHQLFVLFSNRGTPYGFRHMNGYGTHTFSFINANKERFWVKYHFKTNQGIKNLTREEVKNIPGQNPNFAAQDLYEAIENKNYPSWTLYVQIINEEQFKQCKFNIFDDTKVWPHKDYPLIEVGKMVLDRNPRNYFAEVEQAGFTPANIVPGISFSYDKMLLGRLFSYSDTQRYRIGANYMNLDVNKPHTCSVMNYYADGHMATNEHIDKINYQPNSYNNYEFMQYDDYYIAQDAKFKPGYYKQDEDYYSQPREFLKMIRKQPKNEYEDLVYYFGSSLKQAKQTSIDLMMQHLMQIDETFARDVKTIINA